MKNVDLRQAALAYHEAEPAGKIAIQPTKEGEPLPETIAVAQHAGETALRLADLLLRPDRAIWVEEEHPYSAAARPPVVVLEGTDGKIRHFVIRVKRAQSAGPSNSSRMASI